MVEINNKTRSKIDVKTVSKIAELFMRRHGLAKQELSIAFVGDQAMRTLNRRYRQKDKTTDILSFEGEDDSLGELIISYPQINRQAKKYGHSVKNELIFILVHGLLHLIGHEDETERGLAQMNTQTDAFIAKYVKSK